MSRLESITKHEELKNWDGSSNVRVFLLTHITKLMDYNLLQHPQFGKNFKKVKKLMKRRKFMKVKQFNAELKKLTGGKVLQVYSFLPFFLFSKIDIFDNFE